MADKSNDMMGHSKWGVNTHGFTREQFGIFMKNPKRSVL